MAKKQGRQGGVGQGKTKWNGQSKANRVG